MKSAKVKKMLQILLAALLVGSLTAACGKGGESKETEDSKNESSETPESIKPSESEATSEETGPEETGYVIPELKLLQQEVPDTEAFRFVKAMKIGFSIGNTFDAFIDNLDPAREMDTETSWVHDPLTQEVLKAYHEAGFKSVRIPVSWHNHVNDDYQISEQWMNRIREVVDWALQEDMYVILNIHHDNNLDPKGFYPDSAHLEQASRYIGRIWEQVANTFRDYDERLVFESMNEPRLVGTELEWRVAAGDPVSEDAIACINQLNQLFVDTVRTSGGQNANRYLMVPGYAASPDGVLSDKFVLPADRGGAADRILLEVHAYTPYDFALNLSGGAFFSSGLDASTRDIKWFMDALYEKYIKAGVPVIIDEFGALAKKNKDGEENIQDRIEYSAYYVAAARSRGITCFVWDNSAVNTNGENFGLYSRSGGYFYTPELVEALIRYAD